MASAIFVLEDTKEARTELSLLLQIEPSQLDAVSQNGTLTVEFPSLLEDKAMHVLSGAVANHGFKVSMIVPSKPAPKTSTATVPSHKPQPQGSERGSK